jgi:hypothetical protein
MVAKYSRPLLLVLILTLAFNVDFAADLRPPAAPIPATYFGLHIHRATTETPWPPMPVPEWRLWDTYSTWQNLEGHKGQFRFDTLDEFVALAEQHGTGLLLPLGMSPQWASARPSEHSTYQPGGSAEPTNLDDWRSFVRTVVTRYKGRIQAYEIWNEPNLVGFWTGTPDQMVTLTREAARIIHQADPQAIVVSPSVTGSYGVKWFADFIQKGGGQDVDVIGYHFYVTPKPPEQIVPLVQSVRQILSDNGLGNKPLWNTETGWLDSARFDSNETAAGFLARAFVLGWATGLQRFYWYAWDNHKVSLKTVEDDSKTMTPAGMAYGTIEKWLTGAQMTRCATNPESTWTCELNRNGQKQWILWNPLGKQSFTVPGAWRVSSVTPLLIEAHTFSGSSVDIGPVPVLLTGQP